MALVVFLRGVNVGSHNRFQPALLARELAHLGALNIGAAGTFVIQRRIAREALRNELVERLAFACDLMVCDGRDVLRLAYPEPYTAAPRNEAIRRTVTVLAKPPRIPPGLPLDCPPGKPWLLRLVRIQGPFALCLWRRRGRLFVDPNAFLEKQFAVRATTRNWNTIVKIQDVLETSISSTISPIARR